jgi:hypothetical protein
VQVHMREEELLPRDLHVVEHADEPDVTAGPRGADGLHHRLLRADGLDDRVRAEPAGELLDPCRALLAALGHDLARAVMVEAGHPGPGEKAAVRAFEVSPLDAGLSDAILRLVGLLDVSAEEARFLRPLVTRKIVFRLLKGSRATGCVRSRFWADTATASLEPWSG